MPSDQPHGSCAIELRNVSKHFRLYHDRAMTLKDRVLHLITRHKLSNVREEELCAVKNVSFGIERGSVVGLVGPNGSGKSTLLRVIAGIYPATRGSVAVNGTIAPLMGLNLGFHPQLTGEENIYLNASLFGYSRKQIKALYPHIVEFSELEHFIDTPTRSYSSGMLARLGFSVAIHISAEIYLLDEILAVGDAHFKEKCMDRIEDIKAQGKTILFVSHSLESVTDLCERALMLVSGEIVADGRPANIVDEYKSYMKSRSRVKQAT